MAKLNLYNFAGETPRIDPKILADRFATKAVNVELRRGQIAPVYAPEDTGRTVAAGTQTLYLFNREANAGQGFLFEFAGDVNVVRGQIAGDTLERTYYTGDGVPKVTDASIATGGPGPYPEAAHDLGLPAPNNSTTVAGPSGDPPDGTQKVETAYVITYVSTRGEEGPPSAPTSIVERWDGETVELTNIPVASGNFVIGTKRIYRAELTGLYQFVAEIPAAQVAYSDSVLSEQLGEGCPSSNWIAPDPGLTGLTALPNGVMVGGFGNTIAACEPYQPHAWPTEYQWPMDFDFVAAAVSSAGTVIGTTGKPYLLVGSDPASMQLLPLDEVHACASARSMVDMGDFVLYASVDGLVAAGGTQADLVTEPLMLPAQFREKFNPASIHAYRHEDRYIAFYDNGAERGSFTFSVQDGFLFYSEYATAAFLNEESGELMIVDLNGDVKTWDGTTTLYSYEWASKVWPVPIGARFTAAKIDADAYPVTFTCYADGVELTTKTINDGAAFRLPYNSRYRTFQVEVSGNNAISNIQVASTMSEIT